MGTLVGLIAIAAGAFDNWGDLDRMGPALAVAMLTIFYGYLFKLASMAFGDRALGDRALGDRT